MSEADPQYRFNFFRPSEVYVDAWVAHPTFGKVHYRLGSENGMAMLAHLMQAAGQEDGDVVATEVRRKVPLVQYFESLHRLATYRQPSAPSLPVVHALTRLHENPRAWPLIQCKTDLLGREYVTIEDNAATLTAAGDAARLGEAPARKVAIDTGVISTIAYTGLRQVQMGYWATIDGRAKLYLAKNQLVDDETVTEAGLAAMTAYEAVYGRLEIVAPVEKLPLVTKPPREPKEKRVILSEKQMEAFRIVVKQPYRWDSVASRTRNVMTASNWVTVDHNHLPKLTPEGQRIYDANVAVEA